MDVYWNGECVRCASVLNITIIKSNYEVIFNVQSTFEKCKVFNDKFINSLSINSFLFLYVGNKFTLNSIANELISYNSIVNLMSFYVIYITSLTM